tara:strand:- start:32 stop:634 length:603 start_codon:yes stop_codon:yes gene_type:complete
MKKLSLIFLLFISTAFSQLRVGLDVSRTSDMSVKWMGMEEGEKGSPDGMGLTLGYEKTLLLSLIGVGAEYNLSVGGGDDHADEGDDHDHDHGDGDDHDDEGGVGGPGNFAFVYGVAKLPVGFPMVRGIVRLGTTLAHQEEGLKGGLSYGLGVRVKPPILPVGVEAHYTMHNFEPDNTVFPSGAEVSASYSSVNLTVTYKF